MYGSGLQQVARGPKLARQQSFMGSARSQIILIAAGSEIDLSWQQHLLTIRVWAVLFWMEWGGIF